MPFEETFRKATAMSSLSLRQKPACPFCDFTVDSDAEHDLYYLHEHLEFVHPENGESPFIVHDEPDLRVPQIDEQQFTTIIRPHGNAGRSITGPPAPEGASRARSQGPPSPFSDEDCDSQFIPCPVQCGEAVHINEIAFHMELHDIEGFGFDGSSSSQMHTRDASPNSIAFHSPISDFGGLPSGQRSRNQLSLPNQGIPNGHSSRRKRRSVKESHSLGALKGIFGGPSPSKSRASYKASKTGTRRLGKSELGPYAYEEKMPPWLYNQLERGARVTTSTEIGPDGQLVHVQRVANETAGLIPVLAQLCQQDRAVSKAFLCHPSAKHIFKQSREGGFCGYRNIQMAVAFLQGTRFPGHHHFPGPTPSILRLQDLIEEAWDKNFNATGRIETGGIRGTRKYIGTPEAQALFCSLDIGCEANAFNVNSNWGEDRDYVHDAVLQSVLEYFSSGVEDPRQKVYETGLAPIYFQHPGHSLTIVGLEVYKSGAMKLLVFDPMFRTVPDVVKLIGSPVKVAEPDRLLKAFRRGDAYLGKYNSFEILKLTNPGHSEVFDDSLERTQTPLRGDGHFGDGSTAPLMN